MPPLSLYLSALLFLPCSFLHFFLPECLYSVSLVLSSLAVCLYYQSTRTSISLLLYEYECLYSVSCIPLLVYVYLQHVWVCFYVFSMHYFYSSTPSVALCIPCAPPLLHNASISPLPPPMCSPSSTRRASYMCCKMWCVHWSEWLMQSTIWLPCSNSAIFTSKHLNSLYSNVRQEFWAFKHRLMTIYGKEVPMLSST